MSSLITQEIPGLHISTFTVAYYLIFPAELKEAVDDFMKAAKMSYPISPIDTPLGTGFSIQQYIIEFKDNLNCSKDTAVCDPADTTTCEPEPEREEDTTICKPALENAIAVLRMINPDNKIPKLNVCITQYNLKARSSAERVDYFIEQEVLKWLIYNFLEENTSPEIIKSIEDLTYSQNFYPGIKTFKHYLKFKRAHKMLLSSSDLRENISDQIRYWHWRLRANVYFGSKLRLMHPFGFFKLSEEPHVEELRRQLNAWVLMNKGVSVDGWSRFIIQPVDNTAQFSRLLMSSHDERNKYAISIELFEKEDLFSENVQRALDHERTKFEYDSRYKAPGGRAMTERSKLKRSSSSSNRQKSARRTVRSSASRRTKRSSASRKTKRSSASRRTRRSKSTRRRRTVAQQKK